ncbi:MAG: dTDP-4-amino-4,6-dideoxygalactose transaminase [Bacteroidales bacterium]|nr:dTDP-4-amino-4,6-dideoxygalactose transaminase [Bacteroidales bacterium]
MEKIPFNKKYITGKEKEFLYDLLLNTNLEAEKKYSKMAEKLLSELFGYKNVFLTHSSTAALEIIALALEVNKEDEIIMPSYTYVSTAGAFVLQNAIPVFADTENEVPLISASSVNKLINKKTKAIVPVHYGGLMCNMDRINNLAKKSGLYVVEDAAHALGSYYKGKPAGSLGHFGIISFHDTKNIFAGKGGALIVNDESFLSKVGKIYFNGTNRQDYLDGKTTAYEWVEKGSSFEISEFNAAVLCAQLLNYKEINALRTKIWNKYHSELSCLKNDILLPLNNVENSHNSHIFYIVAKNNEEKKSFINFMNKNGIDCRFHFQALHKSQYYKKYRKIQLKQTEKFSDCLVRLPIFPKMNEKMQDFVIEKVKEFYSSASSNSSASR